MKNCTGCKHALWKTTASGRLHPSGDGQCKHPWKLPELPQAFSWVGSQPKPWGGYINRRTELNDHCVYFERKE